MKSWEESGDGAFPVAASVHGGHGTQFGMSLRDYFAAKCAAAMVSTINGDSAYLRMANIAESYGMTVGQWIASESYKQADAMLAERAK